MDTPDIRGVPDKYIPWLERMVDGLKSQTKTHDHKKIVFATHKSHLIGGYSRASAYDE